MLQRTKTLIAAATLGVFLTLPTLAAVITYEIKIDGATGTFDAPDTGGLLTGFDITLAGVTFDTLGIGSAAPVYSFADNDIRGNPGTEGFVMNSLAGGSCPAMECVLGMESSVDPGNVPALFAIFPLVNGFPGTVTNTGTYTITSPRTVPTVPVPAGLPMLFAGLAGLVFTRKARPIRSSA